MTSDDDFVRETRDSLRRLTNGLLELERNGRDRERLDELFRTAHTLKGNCDMAGLDGAARVAHAVEDLLSTLRDGTATPTSDLVDAALTAVDDLDTMLDEWDDEGVVSTEPAPAVSALEAAMARAGDGTTPDADSPQTEGESTASTTPADDEDGLDPTVMDALDSASDFDDLDRLMAEMDDPEEEAPSASAESSRWGTFDDDAPHGGDEAGADAASTNADGSSGTMDTFESIKNDVDREDISSLDRELVDVEFGEFDDDDELSVQELVSGDFEHEDVPDEETPEDPAETDARTDDVHGAGGDEAALDGFDFAAGAARDAERADSTAADGPDAAPAGGDELRPSDLFDLDDPSAAAGGEETAAESDRSEGAVADSDPPVDDVVPFDFADEETVEASEEPVEASEEPVEASEEPVEADEDAPSQADPKPFGFADEGGFGVDGADLPGEDGPDSATAAGDETEAASLPDVDELVDAAAAGAAVGETPPETSFARDEHTVEFESRFAERFSETAAEEAVPLVEAASATIEESRLDADRYRSSGATEAELPLDFGDGPREADEIQSMTVDVRNADTLLNLVDELTRAQLRLERADEGDRDEHLSTIAEATSDLRHTVMQLRLMPLSTVVDGLHRVARDVARRQDKKVAFEVSDEDVALDRSIVEKLGDPLIHLVRNAVDHGIEPPAERRQRGKSPEGTVELRAWRDRDRVVIEVADDGRGFSADRIRQQAVARGVCSRAEVEAMSLDEVYDLVFEPGFSTADEVTDVSGRGVGMDAVKRTISSLDGTVTVESEPEEGTTARIRLPISVAVSKLLFVDVGDEQYAIPASVVGGVERLDDDRVTDDGRVAVEWPEDDGADRPDHLPLLRPRERFGVRDEAEEANDDERILVRLDPETRELALLCDDVGEAREAVVRPYERLLGGFPGISGAAMSPDGSLVNIIDVTTL